ncbi:MAG: PAS domain S-box protein [Candidatus Sulfotelmatobacter sp.]|jgi:PAS domain S-box-containing protein
MIQQLSLPVGPTFTGLTETASTAKGPDPETRAIKDPSDRLSQIVAQDRAEEELRLSIYQNAWEESHDAQIVFDKSGNIFRANRKARMMLRCGQKQLRGKSVQELIPDRFRAAHQIHVESYVKDPSPRLMGETLDLWLLAADGDELPVEISLSPLDTDSGLFINAVIRRKRGV